MRKRKKLFMKKWAVQERKYDIYAKRLLDVNLGGNKYHMPTNNAKRMTTNLPYGRNHGQEN